MHIIFDRTNMKRPNHRDDIVSLFKKCHLLTAKEVHELLPNMDKATVYRNLAKLIDLNIIREVSLKKGIASYELNNIDHQHMICNKCEDIVVLDIDKIEQNIDAVAKRSGFKVQNVSLTVKGLCPNCLD